MCKHKYTFKDLKINLEEMIIIDQHFLIIKLKF